MDFTISDVLQAATARAGLLSAEAAAFLVLSVSEDPGLALCAPDPTLLSLCPGGAVARGPLSAARPAEVDHQLRLLLGQLLRVSVGVTEPLQGVSEGTGASLVDFRRDLRAALVPLNRSAAQRALSRLHRRLVEAFNEAELAPPRAAMPVPVQAVPPPLPVPVYLSQFPNVEIAESVTPYLGSLELDEREPPVLLEKDAAHWDDELLGLTDPVARVAWETDGGALVTERPQGSTGPVAETIPTGREAEDDVAFENDEGETARLWPLPASEARQFLNPRPPAQLAPAPSRIEGARAPYLAQFRSEKAASSDLLREYLATPSPPLPDVKQVLRRFVADVPEAAPSDTPPPVATEENAEFAPSAFGSGSPASTFSSRPSVTLGAAVLLASGAIIFGRTSSEVNSAAATQAESSVALNPLEPARECFADVHVETEVAALVKLVAGDTRLSAVGPHAVFDHVPCGEDARIAVAFAQGSAAPGRDAEWLQVPLPEERLRAAEGASPIVVRAFADVEANSRAASAL